MPTPNHIAIMPRQFYADDSEVVPRPGTVVPASGAELSALGANQVVEGVLVRSPPAVQAVFRSLREGANLAVESVARGAHQGSQRYYAAEESVLSTMTSLHDKREDLVPGAIYVVVGWLAGSVVARRRGPLARGTLPLVGATVAFRYFLPNTFSNTTLFVWRWEQQAVPQVAAGQQAAYESVEGAAEAVQSGAEQTINHAGMGLLWLRRQVKQVTGLDLGE